MAIARLGDDEVCMREFKMCGGFMEGNKLLPVLLTTVDIYWTATNTPLHLPYFVNIWILRVYFFVFSLTRRGQ